MGIKNWFKPKELPIVEYKPTLSNLTELGTIQLIEQFKGEVEQEKIKFPAELGEEHPFDFLMLEKLYTKFGLFTAVVDKYIDFVIGPGFYIECKEARAKTIIEQFMQDVNFDTILRQWTKEALMKGNGFLEIGGSKKTGVKGLKILNANHMYVVRNKKGKIEGYNQYVGGFKGFNLDQLLRSKKVIPFTLDQIAHVPFNIVGDSGYGIGIGYSNMQLMNNLIGQSRDMHFLMERKANSPLQAKLGRVDGNTKIIPKEIDVTNFGKKMEIMNKKTNWATDDLVELKVVDFGNVAGKFDGILKHDMEMLLYGFQIPAVIMGMSNINEGIAKAQMDGFQRRIQSIQAELEKIIEEKIFKRVLIANGLDVHVEFEWGSPSVLQVEARMKLIAEMMKAPVISGAMNMMLEDEMANLLKFDKDEWEKLKLEQEAKEEEERKRLEAQAQPIVPGQNAKFPQKVVPKAEQPKQPKAIKPQEFLQPFIDMIIKQEEKRNEQLVKQQIFMSEEQIKKQKQDSEFIKNIIKQMQELSKPKEIEFDSELKTKLDNIAQRLEKPKTVKQKLLKRTSLLPAFRITRKTESTNVEEPKMVVKIKRAKKNKNYEYEKECPHCAESWENMNDVSEWLGFNYKKYLGQIALVLQGYGFSQLKAVNEIELEAGYLSAVQVENLRKVLDKGFKDGQGLREMAKQVDKKVGIKDLYRMTSEGDIKLGASGLPILSRSADKRAIGIVRTEVTRMANAGAVKYYKKEGIKQIKHVASFGERTCEICASLDGTIYTIGEEPGLPVHPMCRCCYSPVINLK